MSGCMRHFAVILVLATCRSHATDLLDVTVFVDNNLDSNRAFQLAARSSPLQAQQAVQEKLQLEAGSFGLKRWNESSQTWEQLAASDVLSGGARLVVVPVAAQDGQWSAAKGWGAWPASGTAHTHEPWRSGISEDLTQGELDSQGATWHSPDQDAYWGRDGQHSRSLKETIWPPLNDTGDGGNNAANNNGPNKNTSVQEQRLHWTLMNNYDSYVFPWQATGNTTQVEMSINFFSVLHVNLHDGVLELAVWLRAKWWDPRLMWRPEDFGGINKTWLAQADTLQIESWVPDITLWNAVQPMQETMAKKYPIVHANGTIMWTRNGILKVSCNFHGLESFPFGTFKCDLEFGSWVYGPRFLNLTVPVSEDGKDLGYVIGGSKTAINDAVYQQFSIQSVSTSRAYYLRPCCPEDPNWPTVIYTVEMSSATTIYTLKILIPQIILTGVAFATFWLSPECGERLGLAITIPLAVAVYDLLVFADLPTSNKILLVSSMGLLSFVFSVSVLIMNAIVIQLFFYREPYYWRGSVSMRMRSLKYREQAVWVGVVAVLDDLKLELLRQQLDAAEVLKPSETTAIKLHAHVLKFTSLINSGGGVRSAAGAGGKQQSHVDDREEGAAPGVEDGAGGAVPAPRSRSILGKWRALAGGNGLEGNSVDRKGQAASDTVMGAASDQGEGVAAVTNTSATTGSPAGPEAEPAGGMSAFHTSALNARARPAPLVPPLRLPAPGQEEQVSAPSSNLILPDSDSARTRSSWGSSLIHSALAASTRSETASAPSVPDGQTQSDDAALGPMPDRPPGSPGAQLAPPSPSSQAAAGSATDGDGGGGASASGAQGPQAEPRSSSAGKTVRVKARKLSGSLTFALRAAYHDRHGHATGAQCQPPGGAVDHFGDADGGHGSGAGASTGAGGRPTAPLRLGSHVTRDSSSGGASGGRLDRRGLSRLSPSELEAFLTELLRSEERSLRATRRALRTAVNTFGMADLLARLHPMVNPQAAASAEPQPERVFAERAAEEFNKKWRLLSALIDHACRYVFVLSYVLSVALLFSLKLTSDE